MTHRLVFSLVLLFAWVLSFSQNSPSPLHQFETSLRYHRGFLFLHRQGLDHLAQGAVNGVQADFSWKTSGEEAWHQKFNYPEMGISLLQVGLGNPRLGFGLGLVPFYRLHFVQRPRFEWNLQMGGGLGYITRKWDRTDNYKNVMIGSHWNACILFESHVKWKLSPRLTSTIGTSFIHFSNGSTEQPNLGVNAPTLSVGFNYGFQPFERADIPQTHREIPQQDVVITLGGFIKSEEARDDFYPASTLRFEYGKTTRNKKNRFHASIDFMRNEGLSNEFEKKDESFAEADLWQIGAFLGYSVLFGKGEVITGMGHYVYASKTPNGNLYHRAGYRYHFSSKWMANATLKTHFFKADYFEFGIARQLCNN